MKAPAYPAIWLTRTAPHLGYRVMPKCGCSSVGQILHFLDHGSFYPGLIHDKGAPILKWPRCKKIINGVFASQPVFKFTLVRNPYSRLLSTFSDKVWGLDHNGKKYRRDAIGRALRQYGGDCDPDGDIVKSFRAFVRLVADTIELGKPMDSDLHWTPCFQHLKWSVSRNADWRLDFVGHLEHFQRDMTTVLQRAGIDLSRAPASVPRENATAKHQLSISKLYGPEEIQIMKRAYRQDFKLFRYSFDPADTAPLYEIEVDEVNAALRWKPRKPRQGHAVEQKPQLNGHAFPKSWYRSFHGWLTKSFRSASGTETEL